PFFEQYDFTFLMHARFNYDESVYGVMTNPYWADHALIKHIMLNPPKIPDKLKSLSFFTLWQDMGVDWVITELNRFNIFHPISYFEITEQYCDFFTLGTSDSRFNRINLYLNQLDIVKKFFVYFRQQANDLLVQMEKKKIYFPT